MFTSFSPAIRTAASSSKASSVLSCEGKKIYRYVSSSDPATLSANFDVNSGVMNDLSLVYLIATDESNTVAETVKVDKSYKPRSPLFKGHQRYTFDSLFCVFHLLVPETELKANSRFNVFLQQICEDGSGETNRITCTLVEK